MIEVSPSCKVSKTDKEKVQKKCECKYDVVNIPHGVESPLMVLVVSSQMLQNVVMTHLVSRA